MNNKTTVSIIASLWFLCLAASIHIYQNQPAPPAPPKVTAQEVGRLKDIRVIPTSFNDRIKCQIVTDKGVFTIYGTASGMIGEKVLLTSEGKVCVSGWCYVQ